MDPFETPLTRLLGISHPVLLAPMDLVADARLARAVSQAGGLGLLGGGYGEETWLRREAGAMAGTRFGVGFITWSLARQPRLLDVALEYGPAAIMLSFGDAAPFIPRIHAAGALAICQVQTAAMARDAVAQGADIIVAQGTEAGGHGAACSTFPLLPAVADAVGARVPVVAAGGIADGRGLAAALMLGAQGVLLGTRFYASEEAAGHPAAKQRIAAARGEDTVRGILFDISRRNVWPAPFTGRVLRNAHADRWQGREGALMQHLQSGADDYAAARAAGDFDIAAVIAGEGAGLIGGIEPAGAIVARVVEDARASLRRWQPGSNAPTHEEVAI